MKSCPYCQHENPIDAHFCAYCGRLFTSSEEDIAIKTDLVSPVQTEENILTVISPTAPIQYDKTSFADSEIGQQASTAGEPTLQETSPAQQEKERTKTFTPPLLPIGGQTAPPPVPMVQGTPQLDTVPTVQGTPQTPPPPTQPATAESGRLLRVSQRTQAVKHIVQGAGAKVGIVVIICVITIASVIHVFPHNAARTAVSQAQTHAKKATPAPKTEPVPPTQTTCPTPGTARAAVTAPLVLGKNDAFIYIDNSTNPNSANGFGTGVLKRYNTTTGQTTELAHIDNNPIGNARLSADGQWVLFETTQTTDIGFGPPPPPVAARLYMVRVDGQGLQTVYCSSGRYIQDVIHNTSIFWSPDRTYIAFSEVDTQGNEHITILNTVTGMVQKELPMQQNQGIEGTYEPLSWLDNTHLYVTHVGLVNNLPTQQGMYILDIGAGANQQSGNLKTIINPQEMANYDWGFAISPDRKLLYLSLTPSLEPGADSWSGRSSIAVRSVLGGPSTPVYSTTTQTISAIQSIDATTLRFYMGSLSAYTDNQGAYWTVKTNGTNLTKLDRASLNYPSLHYSSAVQQSFDRSISPDNMFIAFIVTTSQPNTAYTTTLHIKIVPTSGGQTVAVADSNHVMVDNSTGALRLAGWTTIA